MAVKEIVEQWLRENGYGGLFTDGECGCTLSDLMVCGCPCSECEPGYRGPDPDGEANYWIYPTKAAAEEQGNDDNTAGKEGEA